MEQPGRDAGAARFDFGDSLLYSRPVSTIVGERALNTAVLATVALFAAFGGVSYAAATIGTSNIKNGAVTTKKLKKEAVTTVKIKDDAVSGAKVQESSLGQVPSAAKAGHR